MNKRHNYYRFVASREVLRGIDKTNPQLIIDRQWPELYHQLAKVLRVSPGDRITLIPENTASSRNTAYCFFIDAADKKQLSATFQKRQTIEDPLKKELGLALALPNKPAKLEEILQHCTELGTTHFTVFSGDRSNFNHRLALPRLEKIVREAVEQSERARMPIITLHQNLDQYLENLQRPCLVALERGAQQSSLLELRIDSPCDLLIGPEGGFSDREIALIKSYQLRTYSLGSQILRNQTAAILSTGIVSLKMQK